MSVIFMLDWSVYYFLATDIIFSLCLLRDSSTNRHLVYYVEFFLGHNYEWMPHNPTLRIWSCFVGLPKKPNLVGFSNFAQF